jgi:hypothetical protein
MGNGRLPDQFRIKYIRVLWCEVKRDCDIFPALSQGGFPQLYLLPNHLRVVGLAIKVVRPNTLRLWR